MAHFARVNENNVVTYVTPVPNDHLKDINGKEEEFLGAQYLYRTIPDSVNDRWIQTSYSSSFRCRYAGIGYTYDETLDVFLLPKPGKSWTLNLETYEWEPPTPKPEMVKGGPDYIWNDETETWEEYYPPNNV